MLVRNEAAADNFLFLSCTSTEEATVELRHVTKRFGGHRAAIRARVDDLLSEVVRLSALLSAPGVTYGARILRTSRPCNGSKPVIGQQDPKQGDHDTQEQTHRMILNA
jgi:hypothetical protein